MPRVSAAPPPRPPRSAAGVGVFEAPDIRLLRGRVLNNRDTAASTLVGIFAPTLVRRYWPEKGSLG